MPPDVFAQQHDLTIDGTECRGMGRPGCPAQILMGPHRRQCPVHGCMIGTRLCRDRLQRGQRGGDGIDAADAAAAFRNPAAGTFRDARNAGCGKICARDPASAGLEQRNFADLVLPGQPFAEREAGHEIFQIGRRGHHHGIADTVIFDCHRHFDGDDARRFLRLPGLESKLVGAIDISCGPQRAHRLQCIERGWRVHIHDLAARIVHHSRTAGFDPRKDRPVAGLQMLFQRRGQIAGPEPEQPVPVEGCRT